jgi:hypothetical protein
MILCHLTRIAEPVITFMRVQELNRSVSGR